MQKGIGVTLSSILKYIPSLVIKHILELESVESRAFPEVHPLDTVVVFADISGFTSISQKLGERGARGSEELAFVINRYMEDLVKIIANYGGDIIKFIGDAMIVVWPERVDEQETKDRRTKVLKMMQEDARQKEARQLRNCRKAVQCALEIQNQLNNKQIRKGFRRLSVKIGVGVGKCALMHVGGVFGRAQFFAVGDGLKQALDSEHRIGGGGEIVVSPEVWRLVSDHFRGQMPTAPVGDQDDGFRRIRAIKGVGVRSRADALIMRAQLDPDEVKRVQKQLRAYVPAAIIPYIEMEREAWGHETRLLTIMFVSLGVDLSQVESKEGLKRTQNIVTTFQKCVYRYEGSVNKLVMDDKGSTLICIWGLPPFAHHDDPTRAVLTALLMRRELGRKQATDDNNCWCNIGIATGTVFSGVVGTSGFRKEYSVLGDTANLAARIMAWNKYKKIPENGFINVDQNTKRAAENDVPFVFREYFRFKGKSVSLPIFYPQQADSLPSTAMPLLKKERELLRLRSNPFINDLNGAYQRKFHTFHPADKMTDFLEELDDFIRNPEFAKLIAVEGPPGSGKTLFVRAGLTRFLESLQSGQSNFAQFEEGEGALVMVGSITLAKDRTFLNVWRPILRRMLLLLVRQKRMKLSKVIAELVGDLYPEAQSVALEVFGETEANQRISFNRHDLSFLKPQIYPRALETDIIELIVGVFKLVLGESEFDEFNEEEEVKQSNQVGTAPMVVVLDTTWLMDSASWRLVQALKANLSKLAIVLLMQTREESEQSHDFVLQSSALEVFNEEQLHDEMDLNVRMEPLNVDDFQIILSGVMERYKREIMESIQEMTKQQPKPTKEEREEEERQCIESKERLLKTYKLVKGEEIFQIDQAVIKFVVEKCEGTPQLCLEFLYSLVTGKALGKEFIEIKEGGLAAKSFFFKECENLDDWRFLAAPTFATHWLGELVDVIQRDPKKGVKLVLLLKAAAVVGEVFTEQQLLRTYPGRKENPESFEKLLSTLEEVGESKGQSIVELLDQTPTNGVLMRFIRPFLKQVLYQRMLFAEQRKPLHEGAAKFLQQEGESEDSERDCRRLVRHMLVNEDIQNEKELSSRAKQSVTIKRVQNQLNLGEKVIRRGMLTKEGEKAGKNIETRYVILTQSQFQYFHSEEESKVLRYPLGTILLEHVYNVIPAKRSQLTSDFFIGAGVWKKKNIEKELREFAFGAKDDDERDQWITTINLLRAKAVQNGFETKFGRLPGAKDTNARQRPSLSSEGQILSFGKQGGGPRDSDINRTRKPSGYPRKVSRATFFKPGSIASEEPDPKLKASFSQLIGFFLADTFASIGYNTVGQQRSRIGSFKEILSGTALALAPPARDSIIESEASFESSSSKSGETSPVRASKVAISTQQFSKAQPPRDLAPIEEDVEEKIESAYSSNRSQRNASIRKAPRRSASLMPPSTSNPAPIPSENLQALLRNRDKSARNSERIKETEKSTSSGTPAEEPARRQNVLARDQPPSLDGQDICSPPSQTKSLRFEDVPSKSLYFTSDYWTVKSSNNKIKSIERICSRLLVQETVVKKKTPQQRPNISLHSFDSPLAKLYYSQPKLPKFKPEPSLTLNKSVDREIQAVKSIPSSPDLSRSQKVSSSMDVFHRIESGLEEGAALGRISKEELSNYLDSEIKQSEHPFSHTESLPSLREERETEQLINNLYTCLQKYQKENKLQEPVRTRLSVVGDRSDLLPKVNSEQLLNRGSVTAAERRVTLNPDRILSRLAAQVIAEEPSKEEEKEESKVEKKEDSQTKRNQRQPSTRYSQEYPHEEEFEKLEDDDDERETPMPIGEDTHSLRNSDSILAIKREDSDDSFALNNEIAFRKDSKLLYHGTPGFNSNDLPASIPIPTDTERNSAMSMEWGEVKMRPTKDTEETKEKISQQGSHKEVGSTGLDLTGFQSEQQHKQEMTDSQLTQVALALQRSTALNNPALYVDEGQYVKIEREIPQNRLLQLEVEGELGIFLAQGFKRVVDDTHEIDHLEKPKQSVEEMTSFSSIGHLNPGGKSNFFEQSSIQELIAEMEPVQDQEEIDQPQTRIQTKDLGDTLKRSIKDLLDKRGVKVQSFKTTQKRRMTAGPQGIVEARKTLKRIKSEEEKRATGSSKKKGKLIQKKGKADTNL